MSTTGPDTIASRITAIAGKYPNIGLVILYGSVAHGTAKRDSDLDVAVMADQPLSTELKIRLIGEFATEIGRPVDLIDLRKANGTLLNEILHTGTRVYETNPEFFGETLVRHLACGRPTSSPTETVSSANVAKDGSTGSQRQTRVAAACPSKGPSGRYNKRKSRELPNISSKRLT